MNADTLLSKLDHVKRTGQDRWRAICPAHESKNRTRSLSICEPDPDRILLHCHAGCDPQEITQAIGLELSDLFPPRVDDDKRKRRERKPWRAGDVISALRGELLVAWVILSDVADGASIDTLDRARAGVARERITHFMRELDHAR